MTERAPVSAKTRFEVFKRDKFTCQYCGAKAPEVILHCDHIVPVAEGGSSDILNLITSCAKCNGGKGARPLSNTQVFDRQVDALAELEERRQQLEMMVRWRDELQGLAKETVNVIAEKVAERGGFGPNEAGLADIKRWLKRYTVEELLAAIDEAMDTYLQFVDDQPTTESWNKAFSKIPGVAGVLKQHAERPYIRRLLYIQGIIRRRTGAKRYDCFEYLEHLHLCGADLDDMENRAKRMREFADFEGPYDAWLEKIGRPF